VASAAPAPSRQSQRALDWFVFFLADIQTGLVPFVAVYLTTKDWTQSEIGFVLTVGGLVALVGQIPGGALVDAVRSERLLIALAVIAIGASSLALIVQPVFGVVLGVAVLQALANCLLAPAVAAISLGLVGHAGISERLGRNARFTAIGSIVAAASMGLWGYLFSKQTVFFVTVALCIPALVAIGFVRAREIDADRAHGGKAERHPGDPLAVVRNLASNRPLVTFAGCALLFQLANAAMMPQIASVVTPRAGEWATKLVSAYVIVPQIVVAFLAPWIGHYAQAIGRRPLLLTSFAALALRAVLFAIVEDPYALVAVQVLDGLSGAILSVIIALVVADVTRGSGHFNLAVGTVGSSMAVGAALSTMLGGHISTSFGPAASFLALAGVAAVGFTLALMRMPETRPPPI
jgi:MFS family permease